MIPRLEIHFTLAQQSAFLFGKPEAQNDNVFCLNHARSGIVLALQALSLPVGSSIGVMAYNCHMVFNAVAQLGYSPVFLDVTDGMTLDRDDLRRKSSGLSALIVSHLFGILNDVDSIRAEFPGLPIIEDCAHAYGIKEIVGDFAVFSIGQGKLPSLGDGGILMVRNDSFREETTRLYDQLPEYGFVQAAKLFLSLALKSFLHNPFVYSLFTEPMKRTRGVPDGKEPIVLKKMFPGILAMYQKEKKSMDIVVKARVNNAEVLAGRLSSIPGVERVFYGMNAFMLVASCQDMTAVKETMRMNGVEAATHFAHCLDWASEFGYKRGDCPNTERMIEKLLMIPTYTKR